MTHPGTHRQWDTPTHAPVPRQLPLVLQCHVWFYQPQVQIPLHEQNLSISDVFINETKQSLVCEEVSCEACTQGAALKSLRLRHSRVPFSPGNEALGTEQQFQDAHNLRFSAPKQPSSPGWAPHRQRAVPRRGSRTSSGPAPHGSRSFAPCREGSDAGGSRGGDALPNLPGAVFIKPPNPALCASNVHRFCHLLPLFAAALRRCCLGGFSLCTAEDGRGSLWEKQIGELKAPESWGGGIEANVERSRGLNERIKLLYSSCWRE